MYKETKILRPNFWIEGCNPNITIFMDDLCPFEIPIAYKSMLINMDLPFENLSISDFVNDNIWDFEGLIDCFRCHIDCIQDLYLDT